MSHIIQETLNAIWKALKDKYVSPPKSATDWKNISRDFESVWHLPHCIGAIDGKHIAMQCPKNSGSLYFNYKGWFSIVLMAVCDASYNFTLVGIGQYGSPNDSSVFNNSEMGKAFEDGSMSLPQPEHLPGCGLPQLPFYLKGDEIFSLKPWLLQPYPGKNIKRKRAYLIIVCLEPEGLLRTVLEFLLQDGESFAEQFKQKLKLSRQLYKQPFVYTTT